MVLICGSSLEGDWIIRSKIFTTIKLKYDTQKIVPIRHNSSALVKSFAFEVLKKKKQAKENTFSNG